VAGFQRRRPRIPGGSGEASWRMGGVVAKGGMGAKGRGRGSEGRRGSRRNENCNAYCAMVFLSAVVVTWTSKILS